MVRDLNNKYKHIAETPSRLTSYGSTRCTLMAKLEEGVLRERLRGLTSSQTSIETASLYVLHHKDAADSW